MSDAIETTEIAEPNPPVEAPEQPAETKPEKAPRAKKEPAAPHPCSCQSFRYGDKDDTSNLFTTECDSTTQRVFAQGHDARLVSTLVNAQFDGYAIYRVGGDGALVSYTDAGHACSTISEALGAKADKAIENAKSQVEAKRVKLADREAKKAERKANLDKAKAEKAAAAERAKAEKAAAKPTTPPREVAVKVVEGSDTGAPVAPAVKNEFVKIKVGRWEYDATDNGDGTLSWRDGQGAEQTRPRDEVRILEG